MKDKKIGTVYLVGAGPGRPDLITLRGAECLALADAVMVDALVDMRLLSHCRPGVQILNAGKRGHGPVAMRQPAINQWLLRLARGGKNVVRLKGGDPYFFGRGGEEAAYLDDHGVPFEVVPGVSSVSAAPSYAGIPLTHRDHASMVTVVTGHEKTEEGGGGRAGVDWKSLTPGRTLVILMGVSRLSGIAARLLKTGWRPDTPAAVVQWGTFAFQRVVEGSLRNIARRAASAGLRAPAVIVVGEVAGLRRRLNWYDRLPLRGKRIVVTRAREQSSALAHTLEVLGAEILEGPTIRLEPLSLDARGRRCLKDLERQVYDAVFFTSTNTARFFLPHWDKPWPTTTRVYAVGPKTAAALAAAGLPVHGVAQEFRAEGLDALIGKVGGRRFLFPRARDGRDVLAQSVARRGGRVDLMPVYKNLPQKLPAYICDKLLVGEVDAVTFTSSSTVTNLMKALPRRAIPRIFRKTAAASIGPVTSQTLLAHGVKPRVQSRRGTVEDLARSLAEYLTNGKRL